METTIEVGKCPECGHFSLTCTGNYHRCACGYEEPCGIHLTRDWWLTLRRHENAVRKGIRSPVYWVES